MLVVLLVGAVLVLLVGAVLVLLVGAVLVLLVSEVDGVCSVVVEGTSVTVGVVETGQTGSTLTQQGLT